MNFVSNKTGWKPTLSTLDETAMALLAMVNYWDFFIVSSEMQRRVLYFSAISYSGTQLCQFILNHMTTKQ